MIWPSSSCAHDLHQWSIIMISIVTGATPLISIVASLSSRQLFLLWLSLALSDKVKQLHGNFIAYNNATTIWLLPVADNFYKTWTSHTTIFISHHVLTISHHNMPCKNKLDILYFVVASFTWLLWAKQEPFLPTHQKPQRFFVKCVVLTFNKDWP